MNMYTRRDVIEWLNARKDGNPNLERTVDELAEWVNETADKALAYRQLNAPTGILVVGEAPNDEIKIDRDVLGREVRKVWVEFCREIGDNKPAHLADFDEISDNDQEVDRRIGERIALLTAASIYEIMRGVFQRELRLEHMAWEKAHGIVERET